MKPDTAETAATADPLDQRRSWRRRRRRFVFSVLVMAYFGLVLFGGCADRLMLYPSNDPIDTTGATRLEIPVTGRQPVEAYTMQANIPPRGEPEIFVLFLDGNGGRAERAVTWGRSAAGSRAVEVWAPNYPGFGQSAGPAKLSGIPPAALATYDALKARAGNRPIVIWGASLGTTAALHVAANRPVSGLILTNPPPLRRLVMQRHGWWNLWLAAVPVALGVPDELDSLANGAKCQMPALFTSAGSDGVVPRDYQQLVIDAYAGPKRVIYVPDIGHNDAVNVADPTGWRTGLDWLWSQFGK